MHLDLVRRLIPRLRDRKILVIGDLMLDEFIWGKVSRISPEAPVPIVEVSHESYYPGGAANVARNLREFTEHVSVLGLVGTSRQGEHLKALLRQGGIGLDLLQEDARWQTIVKTRIIARQQHIVRFDRESRPTAELLGGVHERALAALRGNGAMGGFDAVIIEDYGKGFLDQGFVDEISALAASTGTILTVDPNPGNPLAWHGATTIKPNRAEAFQAAGRMMNEPSDPPERDAALLEVGRILLERWETQSLLITLGEQGMLLFRRDQPPYPLPTRAQEVFDLSGAGDTAIALFTLALAAGASFEAAAEISNHAAGVVVGKLGTAILSPAELLASFERTNI